MKIVFLCGSLEPGRDGVGDYTRRLAQHLKIQDHIVGLVSLNDKYINEEYEGEQTEGNTALPVLRLPSNWDTSKKIRHALKWINTLNPEWLSLQYVAFSFHNKGLPFDLHNQLAHLGKDRNWHIMFHEIWVGINKEGSPKLKVLGYLQRLLILSLFKKLNPKVVHTNSKLYQCLLNNYGVTADKLPLFSNIPINVDSKYIKDVKSQAVSLVIFGPIHYGGNPIVEELANEVAAYQNNYKVKISLQLVGKSGSEALSWTRIFEKVDVKVESFGLQPVSIISDILQNATIGISTTPLLLVEKSGTAAAMREHGLPILCVSNTWTPRIKSKIPMQYGVAQYSKGVFETFLAETKKQIKSTEINAVSNQFAASLVVSGK